jgi:hypothetical protein
VRASTASSRHPLLLVFFFCSTFSLRGTNKTFLAMIGKKKLAARTFLKTKNSEEEKVQQQQQATPAKGNVDDVGKVSVWYEAHLR